MFPYLRTKKEFLRDSMNINHRVVQDGDCYKIVKSDETSFYGRIRGCMRDNPYCDGCDEFRECYPFEEYKRRGDSYEPCKNCDQMTELTSWLINNINSADWHATSNEKIGKVSFGEVHAWCQSLSVYMRDVVKNITSDNIVIGLECYKDSSISTNFRADMMIAGYGDEGRPCIVIIELKQWSASFIQKKNKKLNEPIKQVANYSTILRKNSNDADIKIIPCVYVHNLSSDELEALQTAPNNPLDGLENLTKDQFDATQQSHESEGISWEVMTFYRDSKFSDFLDSIFTDTQNESPAKNIIKNLKQQTKIFSVDEIGKIMLCTDDAKWDEQVSSLRPDQNVVYRKLINKLQNGENIFEVINGSSGSGKTLIAAFLIRYCIQNDKKVAFIYQGTAPITAIFSRDLMQETLWNNDGENMDDNDRMFFDSILSDSFVLGKRGKILTLDEVRKAREYVEDQIEKVNEDPASAVEIVNGTIAEVEKKIPLIMYNADALQTIVSYDEEGNAYINNSDYPAIGYLNGILEDLNIWEENLNSYGNELPESIRKWNELCTIEHYSSFARNLNTDDNIYQDIDLGEVNTQNDSEYDLIIFDEFHRFNGSDNEMKKIISSTSGVVLFIDRLQDIDISDRGADFIDELISVNEHVDETQLWSQFRCNFQEGFVSWVDRVLQIQNCSYNCLLPGQNSHEDSIYLSDLDFDATVIDIAGEEDREKLDELLNDDSLFCLSEATSRESRNEAQREHFEELDELFGEGNYAFPNKNGVRVSFDENHKKYICNSFRVQGLEYEKVLVIIDHRIKLVNGKVTYIGKDLLSWDETKISPSFDLVKPGLINDFGDKYENIRNLNKRNLRGVKWCGFADYIKELARECDDYDENDFAGFDDCYVKAKYFYPLQEKQALTILKKYRVLLTRGLKKCYIYVDDEKLRNYIKSFVNRPDYLIY